MVQSYSEFKHEAKEDQDYAQELRRWLAEIRLSEYADKLIKTGYDSVADMKHLNKVKLMGMGMLEGHAVRLIHKVSLEVEPKRVEALGFRAGPYASMRCGKTLLTQEHHSHPEVEEEIEEQDLPSPPAYDDQEKIPDRQLSLLERRRRDFFEQVADLIKIEPIHDNQFKTSLEVMKFFYPEKTDRELLLECSDIRKKCGGTVATIVGQMQSGKTGAIFSIINEWLKLDSNHDPNHVFLLTSLNLDGPFLQWISRMPKILHDNMAKGVGIKKFVEKTRGIKDALFIIDECHFGAKHDGLLAKFEKTVGLKDFENLKTNNIKICQVSATPDGVLIDSVRSYNFNHKKFDLSPGKGYRGVKQLKAAGQIKEYWSLKTEKGVNDLTGILEMHNLSFGTGLNHGEGFYYNIRCPKSKKDYENCLNNLKGWANKSPFEWNIIEANCEKQNLPDFKMQPSRPTLVLIKDRLRAGTTVPPQYIGIWFDRKNKNRTHPTTIVQGFIGRCCGYTFLPEHVCIYTDVKSTNAYIAMIEGGKAIGPSITTKMIGGVTVSRENTHQYHKNIKNLEPALPAEQDQQELQKGKYHVISDIVDFKLSHPSTDKWKLVQHTMGHLIDEKCLGEPKSRSVVIDWLVENPKDRKNQSGGVSPQNNYKGQFNDMKETKGVNHVDDKTTKGLLLYKERNLWYLRYNN